MEDSKQAPITVGATDGQSISVVGDSYRILVSGRETGGAFATIDMLIPPDGGPGPHSHADFFETFYVIEGEVEVKSELSTSTVGAGSYVVIPKGGIIHNFKNKSDKTAHLLCTVIPSRLEEMFLAIGKPVAPGSFLPLPDLTPETLREMIAVAEKFGQKGYPPDFLDKTASEK